MEQRERAAVQATVVQGKRSLRQAVASNSNVVVGSYMKKRLPRLASTDGLGAPLPALWQAVLPC